MGKPWHIYDHEEKIAQTMLKTKITSRIKPFFCSIVVVVIFILRVYPCTRI